jgi:hypothetical protein
MREVGRVAGISSGEEEGWCYGGGYAFVGVVCSYYFVYGMVGIRHLVIVGGLEEGYSWRGGDRESLRAGEGTAEVFAFSPRSLWA